MAWRYTMSATFPSNTESSYHPSVNIRTRLLLEVHITWKCLDGLVIHYVRHSPLQHGVWGIIRLYLYTIIIGGTHYLEMPLWPCDTLCQPLSPPTRCPGYHPSVNICTRLLLEVHISWKCLDGLVIHYVSHSPLQHGVRGIIRLSTFVHDYYWRNTLPGNVSMAWWYTMSATLPSNTESGVSSVCQHSYTIIIGGTHYLEMSRWPGDTLCLQLSPPTRSPSIIRLSTFLRDYYWRSHYLEMPPWPGDTLCPPLSPLTQSPGYHLSVNIRTRLLLEVTLPGNASMAWWYTMSATFPSNTESGVSSVCQHSYTIIIGGHITWKCLHGLVIHYVCHSPLQHRVWGIICLSTFVHDYYWRYTLPGNAPMAWWYTMSATFPSNTESGVSSVCQQFTQLLFISILYIEYR